MANIPIYRDYYLGLGNVASRSYEVKLGGSTIFAGLAYRRPNEAQPYSKINDIAAPYLRQTFPCEALESMTTRYVAAPEIFLTFKAYDGGTQIGEDMAFYMDYSGEDDRNALAASVGCHANITGKFALAAPLIYTLYNTAPISADGNVVKVRTPIDTSGTTILSWQGVGNYVLYPPDDYGNMSHDWLQIGRLRLAPVDCVRYVVYYVNAYGGWDELPVEGAVKEWREYERHTLQRAYNNANLQARGTFNYANEETRFWQMTTGWLTDEQAARVHHLIGSTSVYLLDMTTGTFTPVVITDNTAESRQYATEGKPIFYTFTLREARQGIRR